MTPAEAEQVRSRSCESKNAYSMEGARTVAATAGGIVRAYRCPFLRSHWHVGHVPTVEKLTEIADAIRTLAGNGPGSAP